MKHNLKNAPDILKYCAWYSDDDIQEAREWFEGFEKDVKELINSIHALSAGTKVYLLEQILGK